MILRKKVKEIKDGATIRELYEELEHLFYLAENFNKKVEWGYERINSEDQGG